MLAFQLQLNGSKVKTAWEMSMSKIKRWYFGLRVGPQVNHYYRASCNILCKYMLNEYKLRFAIHSHIHKQDVTLKIHLRAKCERVTMHMAFI